MFDDQYYDQYSTLLESKPELYASIEIRGVKDLGDGNCLTDDNPDFFSAYTRDHENSAYCIADAGISKLEQLRAVAKNLATEHNWEYHDFTYDKPYWTCSQCTAKITTVFGGAFCAQCFESQVS
jgi:hypothetical protein